MTFVNVTGHPQITYNIDYVQAALGVNAVIDASGEKVAMIGSVWHPTVKTGTINIRKVLFRTGAITANFAGGTQVRVSLQNVSATAGPPYQPDGVQDQFYDFKTATTTLSANTWTTTAALSADRAVDLSADSFTDANSRWLAVVWEFQAFNASDSIIVNSLTYTGNANSSVGGLGGDPLLNTGTWAQISQRLNNIVLECDDGTFAYLLPAACVNAAPATASVASNGAIRRAGLIFQVPFACKIDRAALGLALPNGADGSIVLYDSDGTTVLVSVDIDNDAAGTTGAGFYNIAFQPVTLLKNTDYRLVFVSSVTTAGTVNYHEVANASFLNNYFLGSDARWTQHDGSNWASDTTTRQPFFGLGISAVDDGMGTPPPTYRIGI